MLIDHLNLYKILTSKYVQMKNVGSEWVCARQVTKFGHYTLDLQTTFNSTPVFCVCFE